MYQTIFSGVFALVLFSSNLATPAPEMSLNAPLISKVASSSLDVWIYNLGNCESGNNQLALNPKDLDGTPSKGQYQFKDATFNYFSGLYKIATTSIWNGAEQELIVRRMIKEKVDLTKQFPACVRKLGLPENLVGE